MTKLIFSLCKFVKAMTEEESE